MKCGLLCALACVTIASCAPFISDPPFAVAGSGAFTLRLTGMDFKPGMVVRWNGLELPTQFQYEFQTAALVADAPASAVSLPGLAEITVYTPSTRAMVPDVLRLPVVFDIKPSDIVYDAGRNLIYASIGTGQGTASAPENSIVAVNPESGEVSQRLEVGPNPNRLALSDDGRYLYAGIDGSQAIAQIDLTTFTAGQQFTLNVPQDTSPAVAVEIQVMPGHNSTLAVLQGTGFNGTGYVAIYDNGAKRAKDTYKTYTATTLLFADAGTIYAGSDCLYCGGDGLTRIGVDATGVVKTEPLVASGAPATIAGGKLYTTAGQAFTLSPFEIVADYQMQGAAMVDPALGRVLIYAYGAESGNDRQTLMAFDSRTAWPLGSLTIPRRDPYLAIAKERRVLRWGADGLAIRLRGYLLSFRSPLAGPPPALTLDGIVSSATYARGGIAPGQLISLFGTNLGPPGGRSFTFSEPGKVAPSLYDVQVWFDTLPGIVLYASPLQVNVVAPFGLEPGGNTTLQVWNWGIPSNQVSIAVEHAAPGIYTQSQDGSGPGAILNEDYSVNTASNPAARGKVVMIYGTGGGQTSPEAVDGSIVQAAGLTPVAPVTATVGGQPATVWYSGGSPGLIAGVLQVNVEIPKNITPGPKVPVTITIAGRASRTGVTLAVK